MDLPQTSYIDKLFAIVIHSSARSLRQLGSTVGENTVINFTEKYYVSPHTNKKLPIKRYSLKNSIPTAYASKHQHIILLPISTPNIDQVVKTELSKFEKQTENPIVVFLLMDTTAKVFSDVKKSIFDTLGSPSFQSKQTRSSENLTTNPRKYFHKASSVMSFYQKYEQSCIIVKIPNAKDVTKKDLEKIFGIIRKSFIISQMNWKKTKIEFRNAITSFVTTENSEKIYQSEEELLKGLCYNPTNPNDKDELFELMNEYGLVYSFKRALSVTKFKEEKVIKKLEKIFLIKDLYTEVMRKVKELTREHGFDNIGSVVYLYGKNNVNMLRVVLKHLMAQNEVFMMDEQWIEGNDLLNALDEYKKIETIEKRLSCKDSLCNKLDKMEKRKSVCVSETIEKNELKEHEDKEEGTEALQSRLVMRQQ
ncbi:hypothetical protein EIN_372400, partial [Entamoeba invadens IP1]